MMVDARLKRNFLTFSSCGLRGNASLAALPRVPFLPREDALPVPEATEVLSS
jgi:hypothetical protein